MYPSMVDKDIAVTRKYRREMNEHNEMFIACIHESIFEIQMILCGCLLAVYYATLRVKQLKNTYFTESL